MRLFLYGASGVGKTYLSRYIGEKLGLRVIEGYDIRYAALRAGKTVAGYLSCGTARSFTHSGELNEENAVRGLPAVRTAMAQPVVEVTTSFLRLTHRPECVTL